MEQSHNYAGFWRRFLAYLIDIGIVSLLSFIKISLGTIELPIGRIDLNITTPIVSVIYFTYFWVNKNGQTLGSKLLAIKVIREDSQPIGFSTAIIRWLGYILSSLPIFLGFLWVLWDSKKQGWHDKIAKTLVVNTGEKPKYKILTILLVLFVVIPLILFLLFLLFGGAKFRFIPYGTSFR